jgi:hypothetical protein
MLTRKVSFVIIALVLVFGTLIFFFEDIATFAPYFIQNPIESAANNQVLSSPWLQEYKGIQQHRLINIAKGKNAKQSSTFKSHGAALAIDGDVNTFSHTNDDKAWLEIDLGKVYMINYVTIVNRWCGDPNDFPNCLCRLSEARISLLDGNGSAVATNSIGNTCHLKEVVVADFNTNCSSSVVSCWLLS